jgi:hypothetical protein
MLLLLLPLLLLPLLLLLAQKLTYLQNNQTQCLMQGPLTVVVCLVTHLCVYKNC